MKAVKKSFPLPVVVGGMGTNPLLPGNTVSIASPSPAQTRAIEIAQVFAATDDKFASKPLLVYMSQGTEEKTNLRGAASLVMIRDLQVDDSGGISSASLTATHRVEVSKVRLVNQTIVVADQWHLVIDVVETASYMHTLERMRELADQASVEHNKRRALMASITSKTQELQLSDLQGIYDTTALLAMGQDVYSKAKELQAAGAAPGDGGYVMEVSHVLSSLEALTQKCIDRSRPWDELWPQWGDEIDDELRTLRTISFSAWRTLETSLSREDLLAIVSSTDPVERLERVNDKLAWHRKELEEVEKVLIKLQQQASASEK